MGCSCSRTRRSNASFAEDEDEGSWSFGSLLHIDLPPSIRRSRSRLPSSDHDARNDQQALQVQSMRFNKINPAAQDQSFDQVTAGGNAAQRTEPLNTSSDEINPAAAQYRCSSQVTIGGNAAQRTEPLHTRSDDERIPSVTSMAEAHVPHKEPEKSDTILPITDDGELCSICLEGYDKVNPKLITPCKHDYHLPCILEWMERSCICPICIQVLVFDGTE